MSSVAVILSPVFGLSLQIVEENVLSLSGRGKRGKGCPVLLYSLFKKYLTDSVIFAHVSFYRSLGGFIF